MVLLSGAACPRRLDGVTRLLLLYDLRPLSASRPQAPAPEGSCHRPTPTPAVCTGRTHTTTGLTPKTSLGVPPTDWFVSPSKLSPLAPENDNSCALPHVVIASRPRDFPHFVIASRPKLAASPLRRSSFGCYGGVGWQSHPLLSETPANGKIARKSRIRNALASAICQLRSRVRQNPGAKPCFPAVFASAARPHPRRHECFADVLLDTEAGTDTDAPGSDQGVTGVGLDMDITIPPSIMTYLACLTHPFYAVTAAIAGSCHQGTRWRARWDTAQA